MVSRAQRGSAAHVNDLDNGLVELIFYSVHNVEGCEWVCCLNPATGPFSPSGNGQLSMYTKNSVTEVRGRSAVLSNVGTCLVKLD